MARMPARRYVQGQALQGAISSLDNLINQYFTNKTEQEYNQALKKENLLAEVFKQEYQTQLKYQQDLTEWGVSLPDEYQSNDYIDMIGQLGDDDTIEMLRGLTKEATKNRKFLGNYISAFQQGSQKAKEMSSYTGIDPTQEGEYAELTFQGPEFDLLSEQGLFTEYGVDPNLLSGDVSSAFKQGFFAGGRSQDDAADYAKRITDQKNSDMAYQNGQFSTAISHSNRAAGHTTNSIQKIIDARMGRVSFLIGLYGQEDSLPTLQAGIDEILSGVTVGNYKLQKDGPVSKLIASAISTYPQYANTEGDSIPGQGFMDIAQFSHKAAVDITQQITRFAQANGLSIPNEYMQPDEWAKFERRLMSDSIYGKSYNIMKVIKNDLQAIGMWVQNADGLQNDLVYTALNDLNSIDGIYEAEASYVDQIVKDMDLDIDVNYIDGREGEDDYLDVIFQDSFIDTDLKGDELKFEGGIELSELEFGDTTDLDSAISGILETQISIKNQAADAYKTLQEVDIFGDTLYGGGAPPPGTEILRYSEIGAFPEWDNIVQGIALGLGKGYRGQELGEAYIPNKDEIENMKEIFLESTKTGSDPDVTNPKITGLLSRMGILTPGPAAGITGLIDMINMPQGKLEAAQYRALHKDRLTKFNEYLRQINEIRKLQGKQEIQLLELGL
jgi:hypothetical protein